MLDVRGWFGADDDEETDPVKKTLRYLGLGASAAPEPGPAAQPSFAPEDYSSRTIAPSPPQQPTLSAPFQDTFQPAPEPAPASARPGLLSPPTAGFPEPVEPAVNLGPAVAGAYERTVKPVSEALDAANEAVIRSPLGNVNLQALGRELGGWDQLAAETGEDHERLRILADRYRAGDTSVLAEMDALTTKINQATGAASGRGIRERLLEAGERNPNKGAETAGGLAQGALATALAPGLAAGPLRYGASLVLDPVGQAAGAALEAPFHAAAAVPGLVRRGAGAVADWAAANAERVAAADARMAAEGGTVLPASLVGIPTASPLRGVRGEPFGWAPGEADLYAQTAAATARGEAPPAGARVIQHQTTVRMPASSQYHGDHPVTLPLFEAQNGRLLPLPPPNPGGMGTPLNAAYNAAVKLGGGRKGFPSGFWTDARGAAHAFDSPQEVLAMLDMDQQLADGRLVNWWRGETNPRVDLQSIPYYSTNRDKGGLREYWPDLVTQDANGNVTVVEIKPAKVVAAQEDYGVKGGQVTGKMGWDVTKKAMGILPYLAEQDVGYRVLLPRDTSQMIPNVPGSKADRMAAIPGLDPRDVPQMRTKSISPEAASPGNDIVDAIHRTSDSARDLARRLKAEGVPEAERLEILTRHVRDELLPTSVLRTKGAATGQVRLAPVSGQGTLGSWVTARGPQTLDGLSEIDPEAARILRETERFGGTVSDIVIHEAPDPSGGPPRPQLHFVSSGDMQAGIRASAQLAERNGAPGSFWYYDTNGPVSVRELSIRPPPGGRAPDVEQVRRLLDASGEATPHLVARYNSDGSLASVYVLGKDSAGNVLADDELRARLNRVQDVLGQAGARMDIGPSAQAEVSHFKPGEAGHAADPRAAVERAEQQLGARPLRGAADAGDAGGAGAGAPAERAGAAESAGAGPDGRARRDLRRGEPELDEDDDDFDLYATLVGAMPSALRGVPGEQAIGRVGRIAGGVAAPVGQSLGGGITGAYLGAGLPAETDEERRRNALIGAGAGLVGGPLAAGGVGAIQRRAGVRGAEGALASLVPPGGAPSGMPQLISSRLAPPATGGVEAATQGALPGLGIERSLAQRASAALEPWGRRAGIVRYAGMLADTATHAMNAAGNVVLQARDLAGTPVAAGIDTARAALTGNPREVFFSELPARLSGMRAGASIGLQNAADIMRTGIPEEEARRGLEQRATGFGTDIPGVAPAGSRAAGAVDFAFEYPLRALAAADAVFRTMARGGHLAAEATAAAMRAKGGARATTEEIRAAMNDPALLERVDSLSARSVLQEERGVTRWYSEMVQKAPAPVRALLSSQIPFVRTPYNVIAQGVGMTPAGLLGLLEDVRAGRASREQVQRVANVALGTAVMGWAASDYAAGNLTGPMPDSEAERSTLPPGWRPWSRKVEVPGAGTYYLPLVALGPLAVPAVATILVGEAAKQGDGVLSAEGAGWLARSMGQYASQSTFFEGVTNLGKVLDSRSGGAALERAVEQTVSQYSPHVLGGGALGREIQRIAGMPMRDPHGALEALMATHPATAGQVLPAQDVLGRPRAMGLGGPLGALVRAGEEEDVDVIRAFRAAGEGLPTSAPTSVKDASGRDRPLTDEQQARWRQQFGTALRREYASSGRPRDAAGLREIERAAREQATARVGGGR